MKTRERAKLLNSLTGLAQGSGGQSNYDRATQWKQYTRTNWQCWLSNEYNSYRCHYICCQWPTADEMSRFFCSGL